MITAALLFALFLLFDEQNLLARWRCVLRPANEGTADFTVVLPVYGHPRYFANAAYLEPMKDHVLLVVDTTCEVMRSFADSLENAGWRVHRTQLERPSPPEMLLAALEAGAVTTTYRVRMDADSYARDDVARAVAAAAAADADLCSVKVVVANRRRTIERLRALEYEMAMLGRHVRPWLTSGGCMLGKTSAILRILRTHSLWFYGEDVETGVVAKRLRMRVCHVDFRVYTEVPETLPAWFRQRCGWWAGNFRQAFVNADHMLRHPSWLVYNTGLIWLLLAGKGDALAHATTLLPMIIVVYTVVTCIANWQVRSRWMILYPYYALLQVLLLPLVGAAYYVYLALRTRRGGRYRIPRVWARALPA